MAEFTIKKGLNVRLTGEPSSDVQDVPAGEYAAVHPNALPRVKPRLHVKEGDEVKRGATLYIDKKRPELHFTAPASGKVDAIRYGPRRVIEEVRIRVNGDEAERFNTPVPDKIKTLSREAVLELLLRSGLLALVVERPFSRIPDPSTAPKAIFVNAMDTGPHHTDIATAIRGHEAAFQAGIDAMGRLTDGAVHLVLSGERDDLPDTLTRVARAEIHRFSGPHPAGNSSVHIHFLDPIVPGDVVWTIRADNLVQIGRFLVEGVLPPDRVIGLGGPGIVEAGRKHYRVRNGAPIDGLLNGNLVEGETRIINGDVLGGTQLRPDQHLPLSCSGLTVIAEDRSRTLLGWLAPGLKLFSDSRTFLSRWFRNGAEWSLGSSQNGSHRAMVLTGLYDKYMPMNIMVDYLVRAVIARDTDEAMQLGILETDPEDFALCAFACPSKMDLVGIIRSGLDLIEQEGI